MGYVPQTRQVASAAFPNTLLCIRIADELGEIFWTGRLLECFRKAGQPAEAPGLLTLVTLFQFVEISPTDKLPTQSAARVDWKCHRRCIWR